MSARAVYSSIAEMAATVAELVLPRAVSSRILPQTDHFAPHEGIGFEGWYTRIQGVDFSMAIIMCSLAPKEEAFDRQHYLHFSIVPLGSDSAIKQRIDLHLFPKQIIQTTIASGQLPFTLDAPGFGVFTCHPDQQTYNLNLRDEASNCVYTIDVQIRNRVPINYADLNEAPHGSFARLESTLPLHWAIFSTSSTADVVVKRANLTEGTSSRAQTILREAGRAHMEKNWGVSFPQGWTWSQASTAPAPGRSDVSLALAGGMILGNKAFMIHYRSPRNTWIFGPPYTILVGIPNVWAFLQRLWRRKSELRHTALEWGPYASESFDNVNGSLSVAVQTVFKKLVVRVQSAEAPSTETWLALYCPLPGGHSTSAYETFTATMQIQAFQRRWPFGAWKEVENHTIRNSALEFGGAYWRQAERSHSD